MMKRMTLPASIDELSYVNSVLKSTLTGDLEPLLLKTQLVVEELLTNVVNYAYKGKSGGTAEFICGTATFDSRQMVQLTIIDQGSPYDPFIEVGEPDISADLDERAVGGLGIFLVKEIATHYAYCRLEDRNMVTIYIDPKAPQDAAS